VGDGGLHPYLAAILNGDVAGYTRLMADDADATAHTMAAYRV